MDIMTLFVALVAAMAILLIFLGVAGGSGSSGMSARLERYAAGERGQAPTKAKTGSGPISDLLTNSVAMTNLNKAVEQHDFGANLARELARADVKLKPSEYLAIWG